MTPQNRRSFLATLGVATIGAAVGSRFAAAQAQRRKLERVGLQLYTIRNVIRNDVPGTLEKVAQAGYKEVEFAGYFQLPPTELRAMLTRFGLTSPSSHVGLPAAPEAWQRAVDEAKVLGNEFITVPSLPGGFDRASQDGWKSLADRFNKAGEVAKAAGLKLGFHNHEAEMRDVQGTPGIDLLLANTDPALVSFQIDIYWMVRGGKDPLDYYTRYPGRFPMVHVKDSAGPPAHTMVDVGKGTINFAAIFARAVTQGTKHFFVEHDSPADAMATMTASAAYLTQLEF